MDFPKVASEFLALFQEMPRENRDLRWQGQRSSSNAASNDKRFLMILRSACSSVHRFQPAQSHGQRHANVLINADAIAVGDWKKKSTCVHDLHEPG